MRPKPVTALQAEHDKLEAEIAAEYRHKGTSDGHLLELKRRKLRLKDQIAEREQAS